MIMDDRALNPFEALFLKLNLAANWLFLVTAELKGQLNPALLARAFHAVQKQHYYLNVAIAPAAEKGQSGARFIFESTCPLPIRWLETNTNWITAAEHELTIPFDITHAPLARVVVIQQATRAYMITVFNHLIADGMSGVLFVKEVLTTYTALVAGCTPAASEPHAVFPDFIHFTGHLSGIRGFAKHAAYLCRFAAQALIPAYHFPPASYVPPANRAAVLVPVELTQAETSALVAKCRAGQTTVQGALCAAFSLAFGKKLRTAGVRTPVIENSSIINIRKFCRITVQDAQLGMWASQVPLLFTIKAHQDFWALARRCRKGIIRETSQRNMFVGMQLLRLFPAQTPAAFQKFLEHTRPYIETSNLGKLDIPLTYADLELTALHFAVGLADSQASKWGITVDAVTFNNKLHLNIMFLKEYWSEAERAEIVEDSLGWLNHE